MTPIETGQSERVDPFETDDRAVVVPENVVPEPPPIPAWQQASEALKQRDEARAVLARVRTIIAEGHATSTGTTHRAGPLALCQAATAALNLIDESGVLK